METLSDNTIYLLRWQRESSEVNDFQNNKTYAQRAAHAVAAWAAQHGVETGTELRWCGRW